MVLRSRFARSGCRKIAAPASALFARAHVCKCHHALGLTQFELPTAARAVAQVVIGATIGCRLAMPPPRKIVEVIGLSFGSTILFCP
ncbi:hypothetical protein GHK48_30825 [Sinorhizobium fredii]|uniref:Uncharacterized protein n=1 Tax=Rhizobium fredii TaxID=380 RepID=A0A844AM32_RHIFR|nr:hypothetical protein [Sinorhizobium fredii]MQX12498.1 hypothetical protein [Sinorhizobium fredii]UTY47888.1 hypothetical protein EPK84_13165 [Sinorhizobium fredii]